MFGNVVVREMQTEALLLFRKRAELAGKSARGRQKRATEVVIIPEPLRACLWGLTNFLDLRARGRGSVEPKSGLCLHVDWELVPRYQQNCLKFTTK